MPAYFYVKTWRDNFYGKHDYTRNMCGCNADAYYNTSDNALKAPHKIVIIITFTRNSGSALCKSDIGIYKCNYTRKSAFTFRFRGSRNPRSNVFVNYPKNFVKSVCRCLTRQGRIWYSRGEVNISICGANGVHFAVFVLDDR